MDNVHSGFAGRIEFIEAYQKHPRQTKIQIRHGRANLRFLDKCASLGEAEREDATYLLVEIFESIHVDQCGPRVLRVYVVVLPHRSIVIRS